MNLQTIAYFTNNFVIYSADAASLDEWTATSPDYVKEFVALSYRYLGQTAGPTRKTQTTFHNPGKCIVEK